MSLVEQLVEGIIKKSPLQDGAALIQKWEKFGLLEGLADNKSQRNKTNMAVLLEQQAHQLLKEVSTMQGGDVEGVSANAFPLVRRVFASLVANECVSVQPMSIPSGLVFFLDFTKNNTKLGDAQNDSVFGGGVVGQQLTGGVSIIDGNVEKGFYNLANGYSSPTASANAVVTVVASGTVGSGSYAGTAAYTALGDQLVRYDADLQGSIVAVGTIAKSALTDADFDNLVAFVPQAVLGRTQRRLTVEDPLDSTQLLLVVAASGSETTDILSGGLAGSKAFHYPTRDGFTNGGAIGVVTGTTPWGLENTPNIAEIDIKLDSIAVTAESKKLRAKWTPELQQDMNAYHNVDAEMEITGILSEHIALEIDTAILEDLIKGQTAGVRFWSRRPGKFLDRSTGLPISTSANESLLGADFTGNVSMWYQTLVETMNDLSAQILRKTLRGGATFCVCGPEVANILEFTQEFVATTSHEDAKGEVGILKSGSMKKKWDVFVHPLFPRNVILMGRKGSSFLESGYVYAPYVPLQISPTILDPETGVPRKIVQTRYAQQMVRPDFYGLVVVTDLLG